MSLNAWDLVSNERARSRRGSGGIVDALADAMQRALVFAPPKGTRYVGFEHFALEHGYYWRLDTTRPLPSGFPVGQQGHCRANATKLAKDHCGVVYVEGFAQGSVAVPTLHAWNRLPSGEAVDTTYAGLELVGVVDYFGVPFRTEYVLDKAVKERASISLIDDWKAGWPLLSASAERLADILWTPG